MEAMRCFVALLLSLGLAAQSVVTLHGAGATFPQPLYAKWFAAFAARNPALRIEYDSIGSEAGVRKLLNKSADFAASDDPNVLNELAPQQTGHFLFFASVIGAVVPIVNVPGVPADLSFTPDTLAGIYLGRITKWDDPSIKASNPGVRLPDLDIVVVHRSDGSGTTYAWTDFLSSANARWKASVGSGLMPNWPVGRGGNGNEGVATTVKELGGSIGYVEFIYALQNHLSFARVRNRRGKFVAASLESIQAAVQHAAPTDGADFKVSLLNSPEPNAYPISSFTWLIVPAHIEDAAKREALKTFLNWMLGPGQKQAAALGFVALPEDLASQEKSAVELIQ